MSGKHLLPQKHAAVLTRAAGINNLAVFFQYVSLMDIVEDKIVECFHKGGGVPYSVTRHYVRRMQIITKEQIRNVLLYDR